MTAQEHRLLGSDVSRHHYEQPYKPLGVIDGEISVEECNEYRMKMGVLHTIVNYWGVDGLFGEASFEPLNLDPKSEQYGCTVRDPVLLRITSKKLGRKKKDIDKILQEMSERFPYKRSTPQVNLNHR